MSAIHAAVILLLSCRCAAAVEKPTSFCYGTIGPGIRARLRLHNSDGARTVRVAVKVQTVAGMAFGDVVMKELGPGEDYEAGFGPAESVEQIWALLTVSGQAGKRTGAVSMHSDGIVEGAMVTEKTVADGVKTRTITLTPILVQDPGDRPRGVEPNRSVLRLGAFFTGEYVFLGNPRERPLAVRFCSARTGHCREWTLAARAAAVVSLQEFQAALGISSLDEYVACDFRGATAFCNMRDAAADSVITFGDPK